MTYPSNNAAPLSLTELLERPFANMAEAIAMHAKARPTHMAVIDEERALTYRQFNQLIDRVAFGLQRQGIAPQSTIAICALSSVEYLAVLMGALRAGVAAVPLAPSSTPESLASMVEDSGAELLFLDATVGKAIQPVLERIPAPLVALDDTALGQSFAKWLPGEEAKPEPVEVQPDWPFDIIYSSGTTGVPKGIVHPHSMRWHQLGRTQALGYGQGSVTMVATPLYSNTTLGSLLWTLAGGGTLVLMAKFDTARFLELAQAYRATHAMLVPVQYRRLMDYPDFDQFDLSGFQLKLCTSAPFAAGLKSEVQRRWPGGLIEFYGMTEGGGSVVLAAHLHPDKLHTVGQPSPGHDVRLIDEDGHEVPEGELGEVVGHSPIMMTGYHNQPEKTREAEWYDATGKRFIRTGDVGRFDEDGFLVLMDRRKDMIISGGFNIYPSDLEAALGEHEDVADVAVVGVPSHRWGETPIGLVVVKHGSRITGENLRDWANARLGKMQRLAVVEIVPDLPRSAIGKILKRELRDKYSHLAPDAPK